MDDDIVGAKISSADVVRGYERVEMSVLREENGSEDSLDPSTERSSFDLSEVFRRKQRRKGLFREEKNPSQIHQLGRRWKRPLWSPT